jgi:tetratricopeptide (TPR) repeat protein
MPTPETVQASGTPRSGPAGSRSPFGPWHIAAAVLSTFDRSALRPALNLAASGGDDVIGLLADSTPVLDARGNNRWKLLVEIRRDILRALSGRKEIQQALSANPERSRDDPVQGLFEAYVDGSVPPLDEQNIIQVAATFEVSRWLRGLDMQLGSPVPDLEAIRGRNDYLTLLQPFEELAGTNFAGRTRELQELRDYVGVLPPGSMKERVARAARKVFRLQEKPPLVIHGPGGVGKSALIARFIWEHATIPDSRFPFVYLDFDRVSLRAEEPLTLLIEAVRQLGLQYVETRVFADRVRSAWQSELINRSADPVISMVSRSATSPEASIGRSAESDWQRYVRDFASLLKNVREGSDPCLFVLDTFEEAQNRGNVVVSSLCKFVEILQEAVPRLRIVVVGRVPLSVDGFPTDPRPLGDFDEAAARLFLEKRGVQSPELIRTIIKRIGKSPLSLLLAVTAVQRAQKSGEAENLKLTGTRGAHLSESQIQGYLYRRILNHIQDEEVGRLAYPGLVLRRVTPDIIQKVLAGPCKVPVPNEIAAQNLFDRLAREVTLVQFEEGALVHRRDLRRIMLPLLRDSTESETARQIEDAAIRYYQDLDGSIERAEEIYHRLSRHQPFSVIAERWTDDVKPLLFNALDPNELGARERAWLLPRLNPDLRLDDEESAAADLETWEWDTEQKVRELLERNRPAPALSALQARSERSLGSPLYKAEADILQRMKRWDEARDVLRAGAEAAGEKGDTALVIDLLMQAAELDFGLANFNAAEHKLNATAELLQDRKDRTRTLRLALIRFELGRRQASDAAPVDPTSVLQAFDAMSDHRLREEPGLAVWTSAVLATFEARVVRRVIGLLGLPMRPGQLRALTRAIAVWDDAASRAANRWKGSLGGEKLPWAETLTQAWTKLLRDASPMDAGQHVATLLERPDPPPAVLAALEAIMAERAAPLIPPMDLTKSSDEPELPQAPQENARSPRDVSFNLSGRDIAQLCEALLDAFPVRADLASMIRYRLERSLEAISITDNLEATVFRLVRASTVEGWTGSLVVAALESRPDNAALLGFAERFGLAAKAPQLESLVWTRGKSFDLGAWRGRLGALEARVCRVQVDIGGTMQYGTGFLVGPDLVLTAYHVVNSAIEVRSGLRGISLRFDFKSLANGETINPGNVCLIRERDWLVDASPFGPIAGEDALDYALLRAEGSPGSEPIGGDRAEPGAAPRGWITVPTRPFDLVPGSPLFILHNPLAGPLQVAVNMEGVIGMDRSGTRLHYKTDPAEGSSGAPCFDANWELIAMHEAKQERGGQGLPISAIMRNLQLRGLAEVLDTRLV